MKTNLELKAAALSGAGLALTLGATPALAQALPESTGGSPNQIAAGPSHVEEGFLKVPGSCKWGHATFDPVQVGPERLSLEAAALYAELDRA
jgi:hypothetical protein